jgi:hypothetical protein
MSEPTFGSKEASAPLARRLGFKPMRELTQEQSDGVFEYLIDSDIIGLKEMWWKSYGLGWDYIRVPGAPPWWNQR